MPYTPPSQQSPASSITTSPALSRSSSYLEDVPRSPATTRPALPRSMSSTSYLHKHRRSPSIAKSDGAPPTPTESSDPMVAATDFALSGSVRQSPPPVNNLHMPTGAVISPPDSSENSDGEEPASGEQGERGRELSRVNWMELREAVGQIQTRKNGSPERAGLAFATETSSEPVSQITSPNALTQEARKISHSRSSTETAIVMPKAKFDSPTQTTDDSEEDEEYGHMKPSLVRKKSGELVKPALRPSSRRRYSSMPGTPTYHKSVHFNDSDNQTRHFLQVDKPIAVSAGTSPVEQYESESEFPFDEPEPVREMTLANFPADTFERRTKPVVVERIFLSPDKQTLIGVIAVQNISFHKLVVARFTLDYWKTTSEVVAEYNNDPRNPSKDGCDRFNFHIKLSDQANVDNKTLLLCVRYNVGGQEFWDNNSDRNYQIDFTKAKKAQKPAITSPGLGARPLNAIPRSRHSPSRGQRDSLDDDFATRFDSGSAYSFGSADSLLGEAPSSIKLKPRSKRGSIFPINTAVSPTNGLGGRYDFGASLSAALTTAQDKLGNKSGLMSNGQVASSGGSYFGPIDRTEGPVKADERPDALTTDRPAMGSDQYRDLVQKFCYVGSSTGTSTTATQPVTVSSTTKFTSGHGTGKAASTSPLPAATTSTNASFASSQSAASASSSSNVVQSTPAPTDGADDHKTHDDADCESSSSSESDSEPSSPIIPNASSSANASPFVSRPTSPTPLTGGGMGSRAASPISFGYPYHSTGRDGYLSDSQIGTAILG